MENSFRLFLKTLFLVVVIIFSKSTFAWEPMEIIDLSPLPARVGVGTRDRSGTYQLTAEAGAVVVFENDFPPCLTQITSGDGICTAVTTMPDSGYCNITLNLNPDLRFVSSIGGMLNTKIKACFRYSPTCIKRDISIQMISGAPWPIVTRVEPEFGPTTGNTTVTINGIGLISPIAVNFGSEPAKSFASINDTCMTAVSPPGQRSDIVDITVETELGGKSNITAADEFSYGEIKSIEVTPVAPTILLGQTQQFIARATYDNEPEPVNITILSDWSSNNSTIATIESHTSSAGLATATLSENPGSVNITASCTSASGTNIYGSAILTVNLWPPTISSILPLAGPLGGNTPVIITGAHFSTWYGSPTVKFGDALATHVTVNNPLNITCLTPSNSVGPVSVNVTNADGQSVSFDSYTYQYAPTISSILPIAGAIAGGTDVTITGGNFSQVGGNPTVTFGSSAASFKAYTNSSSMIYTTPSNSLGPVTVNVTNADGQSVSFDSYTYQYAPTINSTLPTVGVNTGNTSVTIQGAAFSNLGGAISVFFGNVSSTNDSVVLYGSSIITCKSPLSNAAGQVNVKVRNADGQESNSLVFTYLSTSMIPSSASLMVSPASATVNSDVICSATFNDAAFYDSSKWGMILRAIINNNQIKWMLCCTMGQCSKTSSLGWTTFSANKVIPTSTASGAWDLILQNKDKEELVQPHALTIT